MQLSVGDTSFWNEKIDDNNWKCPGCDERQHFKDTCSICKIARPARKPNPHSLPEPKSSSTSSENTDKLEAMFTNGIDINKGRTNKQFPLAIRLLNETCS